MRRLKQRQRIAKTKTVLTHLNYAGRLAFDQITTEVLKGYRLANNPSVSLIVQSALIQYAQGLTPERLVALRAEIRRHGCKPPKADLKKIAEALREARQVTPNA